MNCPKVLVYPDYVEIHLNTVPTNLLNPSQTKDEPALSGLHTFYVERMNEEKRKKRKVEIEHNILVKLQRKQQKNIKSRRKGQKETRAQTMLDSSKTGGAGPLPISEAWGYIADESDSSYNLEEGIEQTNIRKLPLCQVIVKNPLGQLWLVGKDVLQGARNGR